MADQDVPAIAGIHHISFTVRDVGASVSWYERVFHAHRLPMTFPHYGCEDSGYAVLLIEPSSRLAIGLHKNSANDGGLFDEAQTGLDRIGNELTRSWAIAWRAVGLPLAGRGDPVLSNISLRRRQ